MLIPKSKKERIEKILEQVGEYDFEGSLTLEAVNEMGGILGKLLCIKNDYKPQLKQSLMPFVGKPINYDLLRDIVYRLVLGKETIQQGLALTDQSFQPGKYKLTCTDIEILPDRRALKLELMFLEGPKAATTFEYTCSIYLYQTIGNMIGLRSKVWRRYHPREIVGMKFTAKLRKSQDGSIVLQSVYGTDINENRELRLARKDADCEKSCIYCPETTKECDLATHTEEWKLEECEGGHTSYFQRGKCLVCQELKLKQNTGILSFDENDFF